MSDTTPVAVSIFDREFLIACTPEERPDLIAAAAYLDGKMREVRGGARTQGVERIAVMAALNITHELMRSKQRADIDGGSLTQQLQTLRGKLDTALAAHIK
jgi:cell division protein ZapA